MPSELPDILDEVRLIRIPEVVCHVLQPSHAAGFHEPHHFLKTHDSYVSAGSDANGPAKSSLKLAFGRMQAFEQLSHINGSPPRRAICARRASLIERILFRRFGGS